MIPYVCEVLQLTRKDRSDDRFAVYLQVYIFLICLSGSWPSTVAWKAQGASAHAVFIT